MIRVLLPVLALLLVAPACIDVARVKRDAAAPGGFEDIPGIPFYVKTKRWQITTERAQLWQELTLTVELAAPDAPAKIRSTTKHVRFVTPENDAKVTELQEIVRKVGLTGEDLETALKILDGFPRKEPEADVELAQTILADRIEGIAVVDYGSKYYVNAPLPWFGEAGVAPELAPDGTMSKADVDASQDVAAGVAALFPVKEVLSQALLPSADVAELEALEALDRTTVSITASLTLQTRGRKWIYTQILKNPPEDKAPPEGRLGPDQPGDGFRVVPLDATPPAPVKTDAYSFSGSVTPPKGASK